MRDYIFPIVLVVMTLGQHIRFKKNGFARLDKPTQRVPFSGLKIRQIVSEKAEDIPGGADVTQITHTIADGMETVARYVREADFDEIKESVLETCRKYPAQTLIGALAVGFLVGRAIRR